MNFDWKRAVRKAQRHGCASSGSLSGHSQIKFYLDDNKLMMRTSSGSTKAIENVGDLGVRTMHFLAEDRAVYTQMNSHDMAVVEEFTQAIIRGEVRIGWPYSCVNYLGSQPLPNAKSITPQVPVPLKLRHGDEYYIKTDTIKVTRGAASWHMHTGHVEGTTTEGGDRTRMEITRVYMCGNFTQRTERGVGTGSVLFGSLSALPSDLIHDSVNLSKVVLQDFNKLTDIHLKQIVVEDITGCFGMNAIFEDAIECKRELRFCQKPKMITGGLNFVPRHIYAGFTPYICAGPEGLPNIVVHSNIEVKKSYHVVEALVTDYQLLCRVHRLEEALRRYLNTFQNINVDSVSRAFGSSPLAFVTHMSRLRVGETFETLLTGHLSHTFLAPTTKKPAIHIPAYSRKDLEGFTLADMGPYDISLVRGRRVTYTYDEDRKMYYITLSDLGRSKIQPDALVG